MSTPKIQTVKPWVGKQLLVKFANGVGRIYDCNQLLHLAAFKALQNEAFFKSVKVDSSGFGISWNNDVDLSEYELWVNSKETGLPI